MPALSEKGRTKDVISSMFLSVALAMIFTQVVGVAAIIIDGIITSRALGPDAYSSISLFGPFMSTVILLGSFLSTGCQVVTSKYVGAGEKEKANSAFTVTLILSVLVGTLLVLSCIIFPKTLFRICGISMEKYPALYPHMMEYSRGYMVGIPGHLVILLIGPIIVMDGGKKRFTISGIVFCVCDIIFDILNVTLFHGGTFGMGMATSVAHYIQLGLLLVHFLRKSGHFRIALRKSGDRTLKNIFKAGSPTFINRLFTVIRDLTTNHINLAVAVSAAAIAARGMQADLNNLMFCLGMGIGRTLISMTGVFHSAKDRKGLTRLFSFSMKTSVLLSSSVGAVVALLAPFIARGYTHDPDVIALSVFSIRCMALGLPFDTVAVAYQHYLQGTSNRKLVNFISFIERLLIPVLTALVLGTVFGSKGVLASLAVGKILLVIAMFIIIWIHNRHFPKKIEDFMYIPAGFGGDESDNLYAGICTMDDVVKARDEAERFCLDKGIGTEKALLTALFIEEMAGNIIQHGKPRGANKANADFRLYICDGRISVTLRDYCRKFDPMRYYEEHKDDEKALGIRMVSNLASDVRYYNAFNTNNIVIVIDTDGNGDKAAPYGEIEI